MKSIKKISIPILMFCLVFLSVRPVSAQTSESWYEVKGLYEKKESPSNRKESLSLMYLDNDVVMFEFFSIDSESGETIGDNFSLASAFAIDETGIGIYEHPKTEGLKLKFTLNGDVVKVEQIGPFAVDLSGLYSFSQKDMKVTDQAAVEILEQLSPAATSLNQYNAGYKWIFSDQMVDGWFYHLKAVLNENEAPFAEFYISEDVSSVYRVDTDVPMLIWGSAQSLINATYASETDEVYGEIEGEVIPQGESSATNETLVQMNYVSVGLDKETVPLGETVLVNVSIPGNLNYAIDYTVSDPEKVKVDENGNLKVLAEGPCMITAYLTIEDAEKTFELMVNPEMTFTEATVAEAPAASTGSTKVYLVIGVFAVVVSLGAWALWLKKKSSSAERS